ncbi:LysR substrate-binding domain-containing protein [Devosia ginsengisoli]|uniref:LysR family transcriptional regulator n=1 Tax=Devosia ginsengisoli TaxID=400770 RepID=A0A5B8LWQ7_9HYPH|nr:LysR substrate-binding domain-containing protein [Devosia ginsengisoli]QDZ12767.1 LysR family transcriptional regulator [Devosia ginsengisoli]
MRQLPHLNYLEAFEAAARHLSFTMAAEELNCTQAAISQRVRALEQFFARPLFHRRSNGLELTEVGAAFLPGITDALDRAEVATRGLLGTRAATSVTVSAPVSFVMLWLSGNIGRFCSAHPQVELRLNSTIWTDPNVELADLSILILDRAQSVAGAQRLGQERLMLLCDPETARSAGTTPDAQWFNANRLVYVQGTMDFLDRWAESQGIAVAPAQPPLKTDNVATALEAVASAGGIVATISSYAAGYLASGRLVAPFGPGDISPLALHIVPNQQRRLSRAASDFVRWISAEIPTMDPQTSLIS